MKNNTKRKQFGTYLGVDLVEIGVRLEWHGIKHDFVDNEPFMKALLVDELNPFPLCSIGQEMWPNMIGIHDGSRVSRNDNSLNPVPFGSGCKS